MVHALDPYMYHTSSTTVDIERFRAHLSIHQHTISSIQLYHNSNNKLLRMLSFYIVSDLIKLMFQTPVYTATIVYFNHKQLTRSLFKILNFFLALHTSKSEHVCI